jgi:hypothetical protein
MHTISRLLTLVSASVILTYVTAGCSRAPTSLAPSDTVPPLPAATFSSTKAPQPTETRSQRATITLSPSPTPLAFPTDIYPDPISRTGAEGFPYEWCPNLAGVQSAEAFEADTAVGLINKLHSGDTNTEKSATDPAAWQYISQYAYESGQIDLAWLDGPPQPAVKSPYAQMLAAQCGSDIIDLSWTVTVCPEPCSANTSESLKEDDFFLVRAGTPLIWTIWP